MSEDNTAKFSVKARLMLLLGQQLITDEIAALAELIKNSYDADAKQVKVILNNVSDKENGSIVVIDDGNGMSKNQLLTSWLQIGVAEKARQENGKVRMSEGGRVYLGEKGLGRLAVHKIGKKTKLVTRRKVEDVELHSILDRLVQSHLKIVEEQGLSSMEQLMNLAIKTISGKIKVDNQKLSRLLENKIKLKMNGKSEPEKKESDTETSLEMNWNDFDNTESLLEEVKVKWEENSPKVFTTNSEIQSENGTKITITDLHRSWTKEMIEKIKRFITTSYLLSFIALKDFHVELTINDPNDSDIPFDTPEEIFKTAHYTFSADVDEFGFANYSYSYKSKIYSNFNKTKTHRTDLKDPSDFPEDRKPTCGPFKFSIYCWDLDQAEKRATFGKPKYWNDVVRPLTGFKLFRDGFRVLPYGNIDNDWLNMDQRRVRRFQENVSREQVIAFVEISSETNPKLLDKSDREGLIDNEEFQDFKNLILSSLDVFQNERNFVREKIKQEKRIDVRLEKFNDNLQDMVEILNMENVSHESKKKIMQKIDQSTHLFDEIISTVEEPLLGAASLGITYAIPTHEIRRNVREAKRVLTNLDTPIDPDAIKTVINILIEIESEIKGIVKISEASQDDEQFDIKRPFETAIELMKYKLERNKIKFNTDFRVSGKINGTERLLSVSILNFIDNSIYWLNKKQSDKQMKFIIDEFHDYVALIVSDNGPGIDDDVELVSMPFYTRKSKGMGLGLYIARRSAEIHDGKLILFDKDDVNGLLDGANIGILLPRKIFV